MRIKNVKWPDIVLSLTESHPVREAGAQPKVYGGINLQHELWASACHNPNLSSQIGRKPKIVRLDLAILSSTRYFALLLHDAIGKNIFTR